MTRIDPLDPHAAGPLVKLLLRLSRRKVASLAGSEPDGMLGPIEAYARLPRLLIGYGAFEEATARLHGVPERLKMLAEMKAATISTCSYCIDIGSQIARRTGLTDEELLALPRHRDSTLFDELDKLVLDYAAGMSRTPVDVPDELVRALRRSLDDTQLVELTNVIALENMRGRFNLALGYESVGFSEGMVCATPESSVDREAPPTGGAITEGVGAPSAA
ncbi:MAG TPA: carboxymuconolactone decarboxylase family protein [Solirubrobacteraceae bacterium]